jgi:hypothetical protein
MGNVNIELTRFECHCLLEELQFATQFCNRDRKNPLLLWEKIASVYFEKPMQLYKDDFRNECLGIKTEKQESNVTGTYSSEKTEEKPKNKHWWDRLPPLRGFH